MSRLSSGFAGEAAGGDAMSARLMGWIAQAGRIDAPVGTLARVGATTDNDVVVRVDGVSRTHARIVGEQDGYWLEDANSRNGTWLNGERVKRARLRHLDVITLGRFAELVFVERASAEAPAVVAPVNLRVRIEWLDGDRRGTFVDIARGETLIGRAESCALVIDSPAVSRAHARISNTGDRVVVEDLGSANGTAVDGKVLQGPATLQSGAEVTLGEARRFRVVIDGVSAASPTVIGAATPARAQDMEWATRLVYSAEDLEAISRAAGGIDKPSPPVMKPVGKDPSPPIVPVPSPAVPPAIPSKPKAATPLPAGERTQVPATVPNPERQDKTQLGGADLRVPAKLQPEEPPEGATQYGGPGISAPPRFTGANAPGAGQTQLGGAALKPPKFAPETSSPPVPSELPAGNNLPSATVLGMPGVGAPPPGLGRPPAGLGQPGPAETIAAGPPRAAPKPMAIASVQLSGDAGVFALPRGMSTVGRSPEATMRIDSREVSRVHAVVTVTEREVIVEDRDSANGTSINGRTITGATPLAAGDRLSFADFEFRVEFKWTEGN
jgi:pSer/pThr/pTyr-binding forkhead associated (FHA) protein